VNDTKRILVAALGSVLILFLWNEFVTPKPKGPAPEKAPAAGAPAAPPAPGSAPPAAPAAAPPAAPPAQAAALTAPEELVVLETAEARATFSSHGGTLKSLRLKGETYRRRAKGSEAEEAVDLVAVAKGEAEPFAIAPSPELGGTGDPATDPAVRAPMRVVGRDAASVTFEGRVGAVDVRKTFRVGPKPFEIQLDLAVSGGAAPGAVSLLYPAYQPPDAPTPGFFSGGEVFESVVPVCRAGDKTVRFDAKEKLEMVAGTPRWFGLDQHYFVSAVLPAAEAGECFFAKLGAPGASAAGIRLTVNGPTRATFTAFAGPKQVDLLKAYGRGLESAIDYGPVTNFFAFFARILLWVMQRFHGLIHNWGVAIILLTVLVKVLLFPLTHKSMQSMQEMRKLQPEVEKLKAKFGDDKEKMNVAVMQLYQQHKVNPLGGCLPLLLQMPVWLALYATLQTSVELYRQPFLWIRDLTAYDPIYVLPLAMGASSFVMQKLSPQPADNTQAKMLLYFMPAFFTFIMLKLPAGLTLYIFVNNLLTIVQQQWLMRKDAAAAPPAAKG
jgi:YidC/Oxa1 family membrane protein insertase